MTMVNAGGSIGDDISSFMTHAASDELLSSSYKQERRQRWDRIIDFRLVEWGVNPDWSYDEIIPPSRRAIRSAVNAATNLRDETTIEPPDWVVPTGNGGVAFRWVNESASSRSAEFNEDGQIEIIIIQGDRVIYRSRIG